MIYCTCGNFHAMMAGSNINHVIYYSLCFIRVFHWNFVIQSLISVITHLVCEHILPTYHVSCVIIKTCFVGVTDCSVRVYCVYPVLCVKVYWHNWLYILPILLSNLLTIIANLATCHLGSSMSYVNM